LEGDRGGEVGEFKADVALAVVDPDEFIDKGLDALDVAWRGVDDEDAEFVDGLDGVGADFGVGVGVAAEGGVEGGLDERGLDVWGGDDLGAGAV